MEIILTTLHNEYTIRHRNGFSHASIVGRLSSVSLFDKDLTSNMRKRWEEISKEKVDRWEEPLLSYDKVFSQHLEKRMQYFLRYGDDKYSVWTKGKCTFCLLFSFHILSK